MIRRHTDTNEPDRSAGCPRFSIGDTCRSNVNRDNGAVAVFATHPAMPPAIIVFSPCRNDSVVDEDEDEDEDAVAAVAEDEEVEEEEEDDEDDEDDAADDGGMPDAVAGGDMDVMRMGKEENATSVIPF